MYNVVWQLGDNSLVDDCWLMIVDLHDIANDLPLAITIAGY